MHVCASSAGLALGNHGAKSTETEHKMPCLPPGEAHICSPEGVDQNVHSHQMGNQQSIHPQESDYTYRGMFPHRNIPSQWDEQSTHEKVAGFHP